MTKYELTELESILLSIARTFERRTRDQQKFKAHYYRVHAALASVQRELRLLEQGRQCDQCIDMLLDLPVTHPVGMWRGMVRS